MEVVRQAHLPGNYELYDEETNVMGPPICKSCWEQAQQRNGESLDTVWLSVEGWEMIWWLCKGHHADLGSDPSHKVLRSEGRLIRSPAIRT